MKRNILIISSGRVKGYDFLECSAPEIKEILEENNVRRVLFIPYALRDHVSYLEMTRKPFEKWGYCMEDIETYSSPQEAFEKAEAIFVGGGNSYRLMNSLHKKDLLSVIKRQVLEKQIPYIGTSAGGLAATASLQTTNDMPLYILPNLDGMNLIPFNINPHFVDSEHVDLEGVYSREERLIEYLSECEGAKAVLALREGSSLFVKDNNAVLKGIANAKLFIKGVEPIEVSPGTDLSFLLTE